MKKLAVARQKISRREIQPEIDSVTNKLRAIEPHLVFLIGSATQDRLTDQSDIDFLLVFDDVESLRAGQKRLGPFYPLSNWPVELVWMTRDEFERKKSLGGIAMEAAQSGELLFQKGRVLDQD